MQSCGSIWLYNKLLLNYLPLPHEPSLRVRRSHSSRVVVKEQQPLLRSRESVIRARNAEQRKK
jgi:hypothetical protein